MPIKLHHERMQSAVDRLLATAPEKRLPIPIELMAQLKGIQLRFVEYNDDLVGLLLWEDGHHVIGVNTRHNRQWQRFVVAHEMAHIELRHHTGIHLDRSFPALLEAEWLSPHIDAAEIEASIVAARVLLPTARLAADLQDRQIDYLDDALVRSLAERYQVSIQTVIFRLAI